MLTKSELDQRVALALGLPTARVSVVTAAFVDELCNAVTREGGFRLNGFGKLVTKVERGNKNVTRDTSEDPTRIRLYFTKSPMLKELIERHFGIFKETVMEKGGMEKYAVDEGLDNDKLEKAAAQGCPKCAAPVIKHGRVFACPTHGTEPFEK